MKAGTVCLGEWVRSKKVVMCVCLSQRAGTKMGSGEFHSGSSELQTSADNLTLRQSEGTEVAYDVVGVKGSGCMS